MSRILVLYNFNKYYNRIIRNLGGFEAYLALITPGENTPAPFRGFLRENTNFYYEDGVYAKHVFNISNNEPQFAKVEHPDYLVAEESWTEGEGDDAVTTTKVTRWYILSVERIRGNQIQLSLRRDLLADYYTEVLTAPVFIQRGAVQSVSDPAIFNKEGFTFNQIKQNEFLLNDNKLSGKKSGWVVGYINRQDENDADYNGNIGPCKVSQVVGLNLPDYTTLDSKLKHLIDNGGGYLNRAYNCNVSFGIRVHNDSFESHDEYYDFSAEIRYEDGKPINRQMRGMISQNALLRFNRLSGGYSPQWTVEGISNTIYERMDGTAVSSQLEEAIDYQADPDYFSGSILDLIGNGFYYTKNGKTYKLTAVNSGDGMRDLYSYSKADLQRGSDGIAFSANIMINNLLYSTANYPIVEINSALATDVECIDIWRYLPMYIFESEEVDGADFDVTIPYTRNKLLDAPYDMFCIPLGNVTVKRTGESNFVTTADTALAAARGIAATGTSSKILDVQILPYCPFPDVIDSNGDIDLSSATEGKDYTIMSKTLGGVTTNLGVILYAKNCKGSFEYDITSQLSADYLKYFTEETFSCLDKKVLSETSFVRFCSPNFAAFYDMIPQKNKGALKISIDYYYKPYTPYIHVMPVLNGGLYGEDYNDPKGLLCSGDFSIATASSKWEEYQVQNKNFQNQFDRQIMDLDINNNIALQQANITGGIGIATSTLTGVGAGAIAGGSVGSVVPVVGTAIGAIVGGAIGGIGGAITSAIGKNKDIEFLKQKQGEARGYLQDMYTYQLGNIKALPNTLNKVSAFTPNNKIFPFVEVYDCTEEEKQTLINKIKYNGMTIMRIGQIQNYINSEVSYFVQGELIRLVGIDEDSQVVAEIAQEIKEGAYYYGSDTSES